MISFSPHPPYLFTDFVRILNKQETCLNLSNVNSVIINQLLSVAIFLQDMIDDVLRQMAKILPFCHSIRKINPLCSAELSSAFNCKENRFCLFRNF